MRSSAVSIPTTDVHFYVTVLEKAILSVISITCVSYELTYLFLKLKDIYQLFGCL